MLGLLKNIFLKGILSNYLNNLSFKSNLRFKNNLGFKNYLRFKDNLKVLK